MAKDLVKIIEQNTDAVAIVDNDRWTLYAKDPWSFEDEDAAYEDDNILARSEDELEPLGDGGYGSGNCYGGDILQALAKIVGIRVESV